MPIWFVWIFLFFAIAVIFVAVVGNKSASIGHSYELVAHLVSPAESRFLKVLNSILDGRYIVFVKVRVADVLKPRKLGSSKNWIRAFNAIKAKHFDFVLCEPDSFQIVAVIELDDSTHSSKSARRRDAVKNSACKSAKVPLLRIRARSKYDPADINGLLKEILNRN